MNFSVSLKMAAQVDDLRGIGDQSGLAEGFVGFENRGMSHLAVTSRPPSVSAQSSAPFFHT